MKKYNLNLMTFVVIASFSILPAYAGNAVTDLLKNNTVTVEQNASKSAKVTDVKVLQKDSGATISGKVELVSDSSLSRHRALPGHVDISIVDTEGNIKKLASVQYKKISIKSRSAKFSYDLTSVPKSGSKLVITHNTKSHEHE